MNYKRRVTLIALIFVFLMQAFYVKMPVKALADVKELKVSSAITQWVLDEPTNTLYAISEEGKNLLFINAATMVVEKSLPFNGKPTDIIKDNGKLYIALDNIHQIVVVDMKSKTIAETLYTSSDPYRIVKDGDKIYYAEFDQHCDIYEYNMTTKSERRVLTEFVYQPDLAIDTNDHILYIGESGSGDELIYYSTIENKVIGSTGGSTWHEFYSQNRSTVYDGTKVYFAGRDFNSNNPRSFEGDFGIGETVIYANNGLVYTNKSIYNRDTHIKLGSYGYEASLVEASNNTVYIYNKANGSIKRFNDSSKTIDSSNVIALISGTHASTVYTALKSEKVLEGKSSLKLNSKLIQWELDETTNTLYGISEEDKALFFINSTTLDLEKSLTFATSPTDIAVDQGKLYVALDDTYQIAVVDMKSRTVTERLTTSSDPYRLVKDGNKIYYAERSRFCNVYEYDLTTSTDKIITVGWVSNTDLAINTKDHILYIGESGSSGSNMIYYSTALNKVINPPNYEDGYSFSYPSRTILFDGQKVYYAGYAFDKKDPTIFSGSYEGEVVFAKNGTALTKTGVFDSESYTLLQNYEGGIDLYELSKQGVKYYYSQKDNVIWREDASKILSVQFNSQGGSEAEAVTADYNNLIKAPTSSPKKAGYKFAGWYREPEGITPWNFSADKVTANTTLYAKWTSENSEAADLKDKPLLSRWVLDETVGMIYGISEIGKNLTFINTATMTVEKSLDFSGKPSDIIKDNGKLYIAFSSLHKILVVDMKSGTILETLNTSKEPYRIIKDGDKIYYAEFKTGYLRKYNLITKTDEILLMWIFARPDLAFNAKEHILYIGESDSSGSDLVYYSTTLNKVTGESDYDDGYGFYFPSRNVVFDGEKVYYAGFAFDKNDPKKMLGSYGEQQIKFAKYSLVYTETGIYDSNSHKVLQYTGGLIDLFQISEDGIPYYYTRKTILKSNQNKLKFVKFISNEGTPVQDQTIVSTNKVVKPNDPTRGGYKFGGWYTDQYPFTTLFDFNNTVLNSDTNLYARWIPTEAYIISYMQQTKDSKLFGIYNQAKAVILESDLPEAKKGYYLGELAKYDSAVFTDINKYFINRCIEIAANPNLTDFLALVDEIDAKIDNDIDRGYFKGQMNSWGRYRVYTPQVQTAITAIGEVWTLKTPEAISKAREAIAAVKEKGSVNWLNLRLDEAVQTVSK